MKKKLALFLVAAMVVSTLAACGSSTAEEAPAASTEEAATEEAASTDDAAAEETPAAEETSSSGGATGLDFDPADFKSDKDPSEYKIAVIPKGSATWFDQMKAGCEQFASDYGVTMNFIEPAVMDGATQLQTLNDTLTQDYDAVLIVPNDSTVIEDALNGALKNGTVVIGHEASNLKNCLYDTEAFTAEQFGAALAEGLADVMGGKGKYGQMVAFTTSVTHMDYANAEYEYLKENYPDMELVNDEVPTLESQESVATAKEQAYSFLSANPDVEGFIGHASTDGEGIAQAIEELGLQGKVHLIGVGTPLSFADYLEAGSMDKCITWDPGVSGYVGCLMAYKILQGEAIGEGTDLTGKGYGVGYEAENVIEQDGDCRVLIGNAAIEATADNARSFSF